MKTILVTTLWLLSCIISSGQTDFEPAYIVGVDGDTIKGFIKYQRWNRNPFIISFKNNSGEIAEYNPLHIMSFSVAGDIYETAIVGVESITV